MASGNLTQTETIDDHLRLNAVRNPDGEALVFGSARWSWRQLDEFVERLAGALAELGVRRGDRCATLVPNDDSFVLAYFAVLRLGAILVPVNTRLARPELEFVLSDSGARVLLFQPRCSSTAAQLVHLATPVSLGPVDGFVDAYALAAETPVGDRLQHGSADDDALIVYTSGTTGRPKGVLFDHARIIWTGLQQIATCGLGGDGERHLQIVPLYHSTGLALLATMTQLGAANVVMARFDPAATLAAIANEEITVLLGVPTMLQQMTRAAADAEHDLSSWRTAIFGAAPMPTPAVRAMLDAFPGVAFYQQCGQTEAGPAGIYQTPDQVRDRPDASGHQARPFCLARVETPQGRDAQPGEVGELLMRGRSVMKCYWNAPEATAEALRDGWLHTGDLVRLDADGAMTVVDRTKDLIITGGRNVYSVEVELVIAGHPIVQECAVVGRYDEQWGESIVAIVTPHQDGAPLTLAELQTFCRGRIADYKIPHDLILLAELPRNPSGKLLKRALRDLVAQRSAAVSS